MLRQLNRSSASSPLRNPVKVLQFGAGNFLRAFVDWSIDIMNEKAGFGGAVQVIQPFQRGTADLINSQDGLFHVIINGIHQGKSVKESRLVTCIAGAIDPYKNKDQFLKAAENPDLQFILSNTTEAGIKFDEQDADAHTLPSTFPGKLTVLLYHRFRFFNGAPEKGVIIIPTELIEKNGETLKNVILKYSEYWKLPDAFGKWITAHSVFCNTLVDRIVPGFPKRGVEEIQEELGYKDDLLVSAEPFYSFIIEGPDSIRALFPGDKAGLPVKFVHDLTPYRKRKVHILNGAHTAMVPVGYQQGLRTVREVMENKDTADFVHKVIFEEVIPTLDLPPSELQEFGNDVIDRFRNPFVQHELLSISLNSISKFTVRILPTIEEYQKRKGKLPQRLVYAMASLIYFYKGENNPLNDAPEVLSFFAEAWKSNDIKSVVNKVLSNSKLWGKDLTTVKGLTEAVEKNLQSILQQNKPVFVS